MSHLSEDSSGPQWWAVLLFILSVVFFYICAKFDIFGLRWLYDCFCNVYTFLDTGLYKLERKHELLTNKYAIKKRHELKPSDKDYYINPYLDNRFPGDPRKKIWEIKKKSKKQKKRIGKNVKPKEITKP